MILIAQRASEVVSMKFSANTAYTFDRLIRFSNYTCTRKKFMWITIAIATAIVTLTFVLQFLLLGYDIVFTWSFFGMIFFDAICLLMCFVFPRITLKKSPALDAQIHYEFYDDVFKISAELIGGKESSELSYNVIKKIEYTKNDIYLFIDQNQAYIVEKSGFSCGAADDFINFVESKIEAIKFLKKRKKQQNSKI